MYEDPLNTTVSIFAAHDDSQWQSSTHVDEPVSPSVPESPSDGPSPGIYGKVPQIYGQPDPGLISPQKSASLSGSKFEKQEPYLRVRITGLDRNRRDILFRFDAQTNLSNFSGSTFRNVSRSFIEFQQFYDSIIHNNPHTIISALPLPQTSAPTDEEDDRLVKIIYQRWFTRVCEDPILLYDEDVRSFIESDFGYQPTPQPRRKSSSGFSIIKRGVYDEDEILQRSRFDLTKLEGQYFESAKAIDRLALARKSLAAAQIEMGNKLINVATTEAHQPLGNALRKFGRAWHSLADLGHAQAISESVIVGDSLGYQGMNARSAKETLLMRTGVLEEYQAAMKTTVSKRRHIERLKTGSNIRPERVDDAIEEMEEANKYEQVLARRADGISQNLHRALITHSRYAHDDITTALIEHARSSIMYERQLLREMEALRVDVSNAAKKVVPDTTSIPKPMIIPPLEDFEKRPPRLSAQNHQTSSTAGLPQPPHLRNPLHAGPKTGLPSEYSSRPRLSSQSMVSSDPGPLSAPPQLPTQQGEVQSGSLGHDPLSSSSIPNGGQSSPPLLTQEGSAKFSDEPHALPDHLVSDPDRTALDPAGNAQPLVETVETAVSPKLPQDDLVTSDPLTQLTYPAHSDLSQSVNGRIPLVNDVESLDRLRHQRLSQSVRLPLTRPRLDPREAASKLANMF